jgi:hypothetical protein
LLDHARYDYLLNLPEEKDIAQAIKQAMNAIKDDKSVGGCSGNNHTLYRVIIPDLFQYQTICCE